MKRTLSFAILLAIFSVVLTEGAVADVPVSDLLAPLEARSLGPVNMGGRVVGLAVYEREPRIFYVASASGGLFRTDNGGTTFRPVFQKETSISLGAVAVSQEDPNVVWVGTGEATSRNSVSWGDGVYRSTDGGKSWTHLGLEATMHIGKIALDPHDPKVAYVAALGRLWGTNPERGIYKTIDAGKTWKRVLYTDDNTGAVDVELSPKDPNTIFAVMWERHRWAYDFASGGPTTGLYKSTDGGKNWRPIHRGIPFATLGKIGLAFYGADPNQMMSTIEYRIDAKAEAKLKVKRPADPGVVRKYAGGTFWSKDGGESWTQISFLNPRPWYFSVPAIDPIDPKRLYVPGDSLFLSNDAGKTFDSPEIRVHPDFHAFWVDPHDHMHILAGCDGGVFESRDKAETWNMLNGLPIAQYYAVAFDMRKPYWIYGGLQDNGSWGIPTQTTHGGVAYHDSLGIGGGDGFYCQVDPEDWSTVYTESQNGSLSRYDVKKGGQKYVSPRVNGLRYNWCTPFILSPHNSHTLYIGSNFLYKSVNRGDSWKAVSADLTTNNKTLLDPGKLSVSPERTGAEEHCSIITISESARKQGLIYVGTDDGLVQVTKDDGQTWSEVGHNIAGLPRGTWCSRVTASKYVDGRVYATFDGHRNNDFKAYLFVSQDYGATWTNLAGSLPVEDCLCVVTEGEKNPDLLYLGSEKSLRISLDLGATWTRFKSNFPTVAVDDLKVHPIELDLVIGTHGRGLWTLDVSGLEQLDREALKKDVVVTTPQNVLLLGRISRSSWEGDRNYLAANSQPGTNIQYYLKSAAKSVDVTVSDAAGKQTYDLTGGTSAGLNIVHWSGRLDGGLVKPGDYRIVVKVDGKEYTSSVHVDGVASVYEPAPKGEDE